MIDPSAQQLETAGCGHAINAESTRPRAGSNRNWCGLETRTHRTEDRLVSFFAFEAGASDDVVLAF